MLAMIHTTSDPSDADGTSTPQAADVEWYLTDHQDRIIATVDDTGGDPTRHLYEPYGHRVRTWVDTTPANGDPGTQDAALTPPTLDRNPFGYVSGYTDPDTTLIKFGTRYYAPGLSTWTQADPRSGAVQLPLSMNSFGYAASNPTNFSDVTGRSWWDDFYATSSRYWGLATKSSYVGLVCCVWAAINDDDSSWSDELYDLNSCFNPFAFFGE